jgi:DNA-binding MarR family transcriptional regulator
MDQKLTKLGLSENEAKVYLALLALGESDASDISKQAQVKRPTTYLALEHLVEQGLVSEVLGQKEKMFKAEEPDRLARLTRKMRRQVIDAEIQLETLLPGLKAIQKKLIEAPKITFYQGVEGIKSVAEEASGYPEPWYYFGSAEGWLKALGAEEMQEFILETRVLRKKVSQPTAYMITDAGYHKIKLFQKHEPTIRQVRILPQIIKTKSAFVLFGKKLAVVNIGEAPFAAVIESAEIAELVKMMFNIIWKSLPEKAG